MKKFTLSTTVLTFGLLFSGLQLVSAASITFVGRTDNATGVYDLTALGDVDWAYWADTSNPSSGVATNDMDGGFGIGVATGTGGATPVRGTSSSGGTVADYTFTNGSGTLSGSVFNPNGVFNADLSGPGYGVALDFTLANPGQVYEINIWTGAFATEFANVVGTLAGATTYDSGNTTGVGGADYGGYSTPKNQYQYTFNVVADNTNDVFNFDIKTVNPTGGSRHVLITAASIAAIPEPSSLVLMLGACILGCVIFRRR